MRVRTVGGVLAIVAIASVVASRAAAGAAAFPAPSTASERSTARPSAVSAATGDSLSDELNVGPAAATPQPTATPTPEPTTSADAEPVAPLSAPAALMPSAPRPTVTVAPAITPARTAAPTPAPTAATCPANWFCYPRLGIAGAIVPYTDCSGSTDVGTSIRSYSCLSENYLMGHAYTQFGLVTQWVAGDVVFAWGHRFTVYSALTEQSCAAPVFPLAPLSMQTSLSSAACGPVLVVQAR